MKKFYFGGKFNKKEKAYSGQALSERLSNDYRAKLLGDSTLLTYASEGLKLNDNMEYVGCFYCEKASDGHFTSVDCNEVVKSELEAIDRSDVFIAYFDENFSAGTIAELIYASVKNKEIRIFYKETATTYSIHSEYWFPMVMGSQLNKSLIMTKVESADEMLKIIMQQGVKT